MVVGWLVVVVMMMMMMLMEYVGRQTGTAGCTASWTCSCIHVPRVLLCCAALRSGGEGGLACQVGESFESVPCRACLPACLEFKSSQVADACCKPSQSTPEPK